MVIYFSDRNGRIIASASTDLPEGLRLIEDVKTEDLETGVVMFSGKVPYTAETRHICQEGIQVGNLVLVQREGTCEGYTITETEEDTADGSIFFTAEDAGLELLNEVAIKWPDGRTSTEAPDMTLTEYVNLWIADTGFQIGINDAAGDATTKPPEYDDEVTVTERLLKTAQDFGYEIGYSFKVSTGQMAITAKYVDIYKKRGVDTGIQLKLSYDINSITTKVNLDNLATSLLVTGGTEDGASYPVTLDGYTYDDGDFVVANQYFANRKAQKACLQSRTALEKWGRVVDGSLRHLTGVFNYDTVSQEELCKQAIEELKKRREPEINYEIDISRPIEGVSIGDRISVIDDNGGLYLTSRVIKYEVSVSEDEATITLGDHLINDSILQSIPADVRELMDESANKPSPEPPSTDTYKTTLFTDGTLIINEPQSKRAANISAHGAVTNEYNPYDEAHASDYANARPWGNEVDDITQVIVGSKIQPINTERWFEYLSNCTSMDLSKLDTSNVLYMNYMFAYCYYLTSLDLSNFDTSKVKNMRNMFSTCIRLTSLDVSSFDTSSVTDMRSMFSGCKATSLDLSNFDTSNVTNMSSMFNSCGATSLDLTSFDTSNVTSMEGMFAGCESLTSLDLTSFDTSNVTSMGGMFHGCESLTSLDLTSFDTSSVTNMYQMFRNCGYLTSLDLSSFDTSGLTNMSQMFDSCYSLASLDVSSFDTSNVTSMYSMFDSCASLTSLDLTSFDTSNVTSMTYMFAGCATLVTITVSNSFIVTQVTSSTDMFAACYNIVGGAGTTYNNSNVGKGRAKIDGGPGDEGYFTAG